MSADKKQVAGFNPSMGLAEEIADYVQNQIVSGVLAAGERISELSITQELGVSRGPVRESLRVLSRRHLVDLLPRKGARVSDFGPDDVNALYDLQEALMCLLIRRVSERWKPEDLKLFEPLVTSLDVAAQNGKALELLTLSFEFQHSACALAGNSYLTAAFCDLQPSFSRAYYRALAIDDDEMQGLAEFVKALIKGIVEGRQPDCEDTIHKFSQHQRRIALETFARTNPGT